MTVEQAISQISALPVDERIRIIQAIWNGLPEDAGTSLTSEQAAELDRRWAEFQANPDSALTEEEFGRQIREARK